jgi:hypothetical protein
MRSPRSLRSLLLAITIFIVAAPAFADTYQIFALDSDQDRFFRGMDSNGTVVIAYGSSTDTTCDSITPKCFSTYIDGAFSYTSHTLPGFTADNGTPCTPTLPPGGLVEHGVCNNGREAFTGFMSKDQARPDIYTGPDPVADLVAHDGEGLIFMNSRGDIVYDNHFADEWFFAKDLSTAPVPEPGSILLLATGALAIAGAMRRRISKRSAPGSDLAIS